MAVVVVVVMRWRWWERGYLAWNDVFSPGATSSRSSQVQCRSTLLVEIPNSLRFCAGSLLTKVTT